MHSLAKQLTILTLVAFLAAPLCAADEAAKKKKKDPADKAVAKAFQLPDTITLTDEQKTKLSGVKQEFESKVKDIVKQQQDILTPEQKTARAEAVKSAKAAGKTGKERHADIAAALKLTAEQKKQQAEIGKKLKAVNGQIKGRIGEFLTADQKALIKDKKKKKDA